jgi:hypothetical protein
MRGPVALLLVVFVLGLPSLAAAQNAGDEQYADPFGQTEEPNTSQEQPAPDPAPEPAPEPAAPAPTPAEEEVAAAQETAAPTLPATGLPAHLLAGAGALLLASGAAMRRRIS